MKHRIAPILLPGLAALLLSLACGPSSAPSAGPSGGDSSVPKAGGTLNMAVSTDPFNWDISFSKTSPNDDAVDLAYDSLLGFKRSPDLEYTELVLQPELAERWEISPDAKMFTFHLRRGAKFQNLPPINGREVTSTDVKFSAEYRLRSGEFKDKKLPKGEVDYIYEGLDRVETPDKYTAIIHFKEAFVPFISYAASSWNPIFAREIYDQDGNFQDKLIGAGPFMLDVAGSQKGTRRVFKKNPDYWNAEKVYIDTIRWLTLPQDATAYAAFQTKQLDLLHAGLDYGEAQDVLKANPQAVHYKYMEPRASQLYLSQAVARNSPMRDVRMRRAVQLATEHDDINKLLYGGQGEMGLPGAIHGLFTAGETRQLYKYDLEQAKRLVREAGYPNGVTLEWPLPDDEDRVNVSLAELLQAQWKKAGMNIELKVYPRAEQRAKRRQADFDVDAGFGLGGLHDDADSLQFGRYHSTSPNNNGHVRDPELDRMLEASRREPNVEKRRELMRNITKYIVDKAWTVELLYRPKWVFWHPVLKSYRPSFGTQADYAYSWLDK